MSSLTSLNRLDSEGVCAPPCSWKVNSKYIPLKIIYFCYMAGQGASVVFRSLYIKHVGMSTTQNGIIWAVDRVFGVFTPPILGGISDKTSRPKTTIVWLLLTGALICACLSLVPQQSKEQNPKKYSPPCFFHNSTLGVSCLITSSNQSCVQYDEVEGVELQCFKQNSSSQFANHLIAPSGDDNIAKTYATRSAEEFQKDSIEISCLQTFFQNISMKNFSENLPKTWKEFQNLTFDLCNFTRNSSSQAENAEEQTDNYGFTFWSLLILLTLSSVSVFGGGTLIDFYIMGSLPDEEKHKFGHQRLWGALGFGGAVLLVGYIKDQIATISVTLPSNAIFYPYFFFPGLFWILLCITLCSSTHLVARKDNEQKIRFAALKILALNPQISAFLIYTITLGINIAVCEIYMFWLAEQRLQASSTILAASVAFSTCFELFTYLVSGWLIRKFGARIVMVIGLFILGVRLILYTVVTKAWHLLFAEILRGLGWPSSWIATCHHTTAVSPPGLAATTMGMVQASTFGIGYGVGALLGGYLFQRFGGDTMFLMMFALVSFVSLFYFIFYRSYDWLMMKRRKEKSVEEIEKLNPIREDLNHKVGEFGDYPRFPPEQEPKDETL